MAVINDLKASIVTKMQSVSALQNVYGYRTSKIDGFPIAIVTYQSFDSEYLDNTRDLRMYTFQIEIIQEREPHGFGIEKGERVLGEAIDEVMAVIDADTDFSNSEVQYSHPFSNEIDDSNEFLRATIRITMKALVQTSI